MKLRKLTIHGLGNKMASTIIDLIPEELEYELSTDDAHKNGRGRGKSPRASGVTEAILRFMVDNKLKTITRNRTKQLAEKSNAKNPGATLAGLCKAGYLRQTSTNVFEITAKGKEHIS